MPWLLARHMPVQSMHLLVVVSVDLLTLQSTYSLYRYAATFPVDQILCTFEVVAAPVYQ